MTAKKPNEGLHAWRAGEHIVDYVHGNTGFTPYGHSYIMYNTTEEGDRGERVARLDLHPNGMVSSIETHPEHRRQGLATKLWNFATETSGKYEDVPAPQHSDSRTPLGEKWARSMGAPKSRDELISQRQFKNARWD